MKSLGKRGSKRSSGKEGKYFISLLRSVLTEPSRETLLLLDDEEKVFVVFLPPPKEDSQHHGQSFEKDCDNLTSLMEQERTVEKHSLASSRKKNRRGDFETVTIGLSHGNGRVVRLHIYFCEHCLLTHPQEPDNFAKKSKVSKKIGTVLSNHPASIRLAGYASRMPSIFVL